MRRTSKSSQTSSIFLKTSFQRPHINRDAAVNHGSMLARPEKVRRLAGSGVPAGPDFGSRDGQRGQAVGHRRKGRRHRSGQQRSGQNVPGDSSGTGIRNSARCGTDRDVQVRFFRLCLTKMSLSTLVPSNARDPEVVAAPAKIRAFH